MSKREISALNEAATLTRPVRPILFARMDFATTPRMVHTEIGPRLVTHPIYGTEEYVGIGDFGGMTTDLVESVSNAAQSIKLSITGIKKDYMRGVLTDDYHRRSIDLMFGFDDENSELVDDPVIIDSRFMDKADINLGEQTADITLTCESRAIDLQGSSDLRFTDEDLQIEFPGDLAGEYIFRMADLVLKWGGDRIQQTSSGVRRGFGPPRS